MMDRLLQNNTILKIVAAFLAILLWLTVHTGQETGGTVESGAGFVGGSTQTLKDKPVTVLYNEQLYSLVGEPKVDLTLRGPTIDVLRAAMTGGSIEVLADARHLGEGAHEVEVFTRGQPPGVEIAPAKVTITLEKNTNKEFSITLVTEGKPREGLNVGDAIVTPKTVIVSGAQSAVNAVARVVATINVDKAQESLQTSAPLIALDKDGKQVKNVHLSHDRAEINVPITRPSKSVPLQLQFKGDLAPGYAVESINPTGTVTVYGNAATLATLDTYPAPVIDLSGLDKTTRVKLKLAQIEGVTSVEPQEVEVEVNVVKAVERTFADIPFKVTGLTEGQSYTIVDTSDRVSVTVSGAKSLVEKLTPQDLHAYVDVTNQPAGRQQMRVQVNAPNFIRVLSVDPANVNLEVKK
jgi:YbbR domain-containing protein